MIRKILVIEDNPSVQKIIAGFLKDAYELTFTASLDEAFRLATQRIFDLFLVDLTLPDGNGLDFLESMKKKEKYDAIPFLCVTANSQLSDKLKAFDLGADDYIVKPFSPLELRARISARFRPLDIGL